MASLWQKFKSSAVRSAKYTALRAGHAALGNFGRGVVFDYLKHNRDLKRAKSGKEVAEERKARVEQAGPVLKANIAALEKSFNRLISAAGRLEKAAGGTPSESGKDKKSGKFTAADALGKSPAVKDEPSLIESLGLTNWKNWAAAGTAATLTKLIVRRLPVVGALATGVFEYARTGNKAKAIGAGAGAGLGGWGGALLGQAVIPIPVVGAGIGLLAGSLLGGFLGSKVGGVLSGDDNTPGEHDLTYVSARLFFKADKITFKRRRKQGPAPGRSRWRHGFGAPGGGGAGPPRGPARGPGEPSKALPLDTQPQRVQPTGPETRPSQVTGPEPLKREPSGPEPGKRTSPGRAPERRPQQQGQPQQPPPGVTPVDTSDKFGSMAPTPVHGFETRRGEQGEFNYARTGALGSPGQNIETVTLNSGKKLHVNANMADRFKGFFNELEGRGYTIKDIGGYANRNIAGGGVSQHAYGNAVDVNAYKPNSAPGQKQATDLPDEVEKLAWKHGISWGARFNDPMHFEGMGPSAWKNKMDELVRQGYISKDEAEARISGRPVQKPASPAVKAPDPAPAVPAAAPEAPTNISADAPVPAMKAVGDDGPYPSLARKNVQRSLGGGKKPFDDYKPQGDGPDSPNIEDRRHEDTLIKKLFPGLDNFKSPFNKRDMENLGHQFNKEYGSGMFEPVPPENDMSKALGIDDIPALGRPGGQETQGRQRDQIDRKEKGDRLTHGERQETSTTKDQEDESDSLSFTQSTGTETGTPAYE